MPGILAAAVYCSDGLHSRSTVRRTLLLRSCRDIMASAIAVDPYGAAGAFRLCFGGTPGLAVRGIGLAFTIFLAGHRMPHVAMGRIRNL